MIGRRDRVRRVAIYLRVSTREQTTDNQRRELQAVAALNGWEIVRVFEDAGISGAKGRSGRPGLDALIKAVTRREVDLVAAWSVDRLGRSLTDLLEFLRELHAKGVDLFLHQQGIDTTTPAGRAMFQLLGVFAEFERSIIQERVRAGLARARANGVVLGRPKLDDHKALMIRSHLAQGLSVDRVAGLVGCGTSTVKRCRADMRRS
jgi:DNA invertase Pin-like site-specific DNA recombinase